jgi:hypothetical protein
VFGGFLGKKKVPKVIKISDTEIEAPIAQSVMSKIQSNIEPKIEAL